MILKSLDSLALDAVIPAKAGIQVLLLVHRFRGVDDKGTSFRQYKGSSSSWNEYKPHETEPDIFIRPKLEAFFGKP